MRENLLLTVEIIIGLFLWNFHSSYPNKITNAFTPLICWNPSKFYFREHIQRWNFKQNAQTAVDLLFCGVKGQMSWDLGKSFDPFVTHMCR